MALARANAVIVGAGAAGGIVAKELAEAGLTVVLLERGKWYTAFDCRKDDLRNQRTSLLGCAFGPDDDRYRRVVVGPDGQERIVAPSDGAYSNNAACVGGGTFSYGAMGWRYLEKDFRMRSTYGAVAGSTLEDWPISYQDLEPYYTKAEWEIGVSGDDSNNIFKGPRSRPLPMPPPPPSREHQILKAAAERLKLYPFDIPMLRNTVPYDGRGACMRCRWCVGFACEVDAKCGTHNTVIPRALKTQLHAAHGMRGEGNPDERAGPGDGRRLLRRARQAPGATRRPRDRLRVGHRDATPAAQFQEPSFSERPR